MTSGSLSVWLRWVFNAPCLIFNDTSFPLPWNIGNYPCLSVLGLPQNVRIQRSMPFIFDYPNRTDCHVHDVLATLFMCEGTKLLWNILNCGKYVHFMTKNLKLDSNTYLLHLSCPGLMLIVSNDALYIYFLFKIPAWTSKLLDLCWNHHFQQFRSALRNCWVI